MKNTINDMLKARGWDQEPLIIGLFVLIFIVWNVLKEFPGLYAFFQNQFDWNKKNLQAWQEFKKEWSDNLRCFEKDLLIKNVPFFRYFDTKEVEVVLSCHFDIRTIESLNVLKKYDLIAIHNSDCFAIPQCSYIFRRAMNLINIVMVLCFVFAFYAVFYFGANADQDVTWLSCIFFFCVFLIEFILIRRNDYIQAYSWLRKNKLANIVYSEDFHKLIKEIN